MILKFSFLMVRDYFSGKKDIGKKAGLYGSFSYLIGLRAFRKDGSVRG